MRHIIGATIATTIAALIWYTRKPLLRHLFYNPREITENPPDWAPRHRTWIKGIEQ